MINDGGPAFPNDKSLYLPEYTYHAQGMSLRDWFAGQALNGCLAYSHYNEAWGDYHNNGTDESLAAKAYALADAMLAAREGGDQS